MTQEALPPQLPPRQPGRITDGMIKHGEAMLVTEADAARGDAEALTAVDTKRASEAILVGSSSLDPATRDDILDHFAGANKVSRSPKQEGDDPIIEDGWVLRGAASVKDGSIMIVFGKEDPEQPGFFIEKPVPMDSALKLNPKEVVAETSAEDDYTTLTAEQLAELRQAQAIGEDAVASAVELNEVPISEAEAEDSSDGADEALITDVDAEQDEPAEVDLAAVFSSGSSLEAALQDPTISSEAQNGIKAVIESWKEVRRAVAVSTAWTEVIQPNFKQLGEALPSVTAKVENVGAMIENLVAGYRGLANSIESGYGMEGVHDVFQSTGFGTILEDLSANAHQLAQDGELQEATNQLRNAELEGDELVQKATAPDSEPTPEDYDAIAEKVAPLIAAGSSLDTVSTELRNDMPENVIPSWRNKLEIVDEMAAFASRGDIDIDALPRAIISITEQLEPFVDAAQRGAFSFDASEARYLAVHAEEVFHSNLQPILDSLRRAADYAVEAA
jgi:hypothetical protein